MKTFSLLSMLGSYALMITFALLYFSVKQSAAIQTGLIITGAIISSALFIISIIAVTTYKWGNKNSYSPVF